MSKSHNKSLHSDKFSTAWPPLMLSVSRTSNRWNLE